MYPHPDGLGDLQSPSIQWTRCYPLNARVAHGRMELRFSNNSPRSRFAARQLAVLIFSQLRASRPAASIWELFHAVRGIRLLSAVTA